MRAEQNCKPLANERAAVTAASSRKAAVTPIRLEWRFLLNRLPGPGSLGHPCQVLSVFWLGGDPLSQKAQLASKGRGWSPLRIDSGSSRVPPSSQSATPKMASPHPLASGPIALLRRPHSTWLAFTQGCIPAEPSPDSSREVWRVSLPPPPPSPSLTAPALPRAAATATAAGAAPPPCQLLSCNGDWAAAAEVTPGAGERGRTCAWEDCGEPQLGRGLAAGQRKAASAPLLPCLPPGGSREPGRGGHPVRPRSGEARPGSPGAGRGGVTAPSARPRGMHRGSRGRRRHSQVSCGETWRSLLRLGCLCPRSQVPEVAREAGRGPPGTAWRPPRGPSLGPETFPGGSSWDLGSRTYWCPRKTRFLCLPASVALSTLAPPLVCIELSHLSPLVSEVSLLRLEIEHILGNSGALAPVSGTVSVPFPGCNILKVQYGENFDHLQSSSSCWMESTGLFTHDWVERGWHLTSLTRWKLSLSLPSPLF